MDQETFDAYVKAGRIVATARDYGKSLIKVGASVLKVAEAVEKRIIELGGSFAFPPQISINDIAAHYCPEPDDKTVFRENDVVKLDVGVHINGFVGDTAVTVVLGDDEKLKKLQEASRQALKAALGLVKPGVTLSELGRAIHHEITSRGFAPVKNLSGHGLARFVIHDKPSIPNFDTGSQEELHQDQVIAIEPFASTGAGEIYESSNPTLFSLNGKKPVRSPITRQVLRDLEEYNGLPFTLRWIADKHGLGKARFALRELKKTGILEEYPPLLDKTHGIVSQAEHTIIVKEQGESIITTMLDKD